MVEDLASKSSKDHPDIIEDEQVLILIDTEL